MQNRGQHTYFSRKMCILTTLVLLGVSGMFIAYRTKTQVRELFRMNKELQEQNYYMAEFEFKMLGLAYHLDKGHYYTSLALLHRLHAQLQSGEHLIKMPDFTSKEEEFEFYLNLQNPRTGAFMDDSYPLCTYHGPTENVLLHLEALARGIGRPLRLKYPLKYLDEINTPEKLIAFLDEVSTVGWIASKFPQTTFHNARDLLSLASDPANSHENEADFVIQNNQLYQFSPEWKQAMLRWFWEHQDPETGLWGPKSQHGKLMKKDVNNTASILKAFVNKQGHTIHESFPLRYKQQLFESVLAALSEPVPPDDELDKLHEWNLKTPKSIALLTRYIWKDASQEQKEKARGLIENFIRIKCEKYYLPEEGAFSYYPGGDHATLDGTRGFFIFKDIGAFSWKKQQELWGTPAENMIDAGVHEISELTQQAIEAIAQAESINSLRFYRGEPNDTDLFSDVFAVVYPRKTSVLDMMDFVQRIRHWIETTPQTMGNWVSKAEIRSQLASLPIEDTPVYEAHIPHERVHAVLQQHAVLVVIGFDVLQIPRWKIVYISR